MADPAKKKKKKSPLNQTIDGDTGGVSIARQSKIFSAPQSTRSNAHKRGYYTPRGAQRSVVCMHGSVSSALFPELLR